MLMSGRTVDKIGRLVVIIKAAMLCTLCFVACLAVAAEAAAGKHEYCAPSSCGEITNISYPFRLKGDPRLDCGDRRYELSCEDNRTVLYLHDQARYYVEEICYENRTIRVVDSGLRDDNCSSMPHYSLNHFNFSSNGRGKPYGFAYHAESIMDVALLSCETPQTIGCRNNNYYSDLCLLYMPACINGSVDSSISSSCQKHYSYALVGDELDIRNIPESCSVNLVVPAGLENLENFSFRHIHHKMAMGFLLWFRIDCAGCDAKGYYCSMGRDAYGKYATECFKFWQCRSAFQSFSCA